ncbi:MAG: hypothetical protein FJW26_03150 [Acidimicrobiia bacterium]|nr:hypothetical protein [Acidimicrobiia bacterium]
MITSSYSVAFLLQAVLSGVVSLAGLAGTIALLLASRTSRSAVEQTQGEERVLLLSSTLIGLLAIRLASWFGFYGLLESYVPQIPGAMCPFGVADATPDESFVLQASRMSVFVVGGCWLSSHALHQRSPRRAARQNVVRLAVPLFVLLLFDAASDLRFLLARREGVHVSCCSTVRETGFGPASLRRTPGGSGQSEGAGTAALFGLGGLFAALCGLLQTRWIAETFNSISRGSGGVSVALKTRLLTSQRGKGAGGKGEFYDVVQVPPIRMLSQVPWLGLWLAAALGLGFLVVAYSVYTEHLSTRLLGLPYHRCPYELLTRTPDFLIIAFLVLLGAVAPLWALSVSWISRELTDVVHTVKHGLLRLSTSGTVIALLMIATHLVMAP